MAMHPSRQAALGLAPGPAPAARGNLQTSKGKQPERPYIGPWSSHALDAASHGAIAFCQIYYEAYDEPTRRDTEIPQLFLPQAKVVWNGNPVPADLPNFMGFLKGVPLSRHDLQTLDCHPIPVLDPAAPPSSAPDIIVNVTGSVLHGPHVLAGFNDAQATHAPQNHPRKFHEMFMLRAAEQGEGMQPKYAIHSSNFRFIG
ncbi:uncharacterized protein MKK02DRAFT_37961 [Dioszegia hungarica]|uniref:NTF2 domain-containing protein n=1 Tax=Dioszegia hungarica TaxID=4972 RepID=A0AA38H5J4_9TREE|nr:uncharacterized protein MKK02DRAFT_37961 [Dioszegia hungarica]KAI9634430.1 hypothetical protein MKK02DRAFT_37961 [Dioszegia hungarica]